jgi:hypothetical protein
MQGTARQCSKPSPSHAIFSKPASLLLECSRPPAERYNITLPLSNAAANLPAAVQNGSASSSAHTIYRLQFRRCCSCARKVGLTSQDADLFSLTMSQSTTR